ncbi:alpha/beta fold hydrolase [Nocardioides sp.]|uniref:alpha/beta fold hydrolase n=1 Tax=Nocardioides sp. TaxID=35761 RepID=UPI00286DDC93|nr:alpha/beta fold hydrolase [Nocardioides sp.]
MTGSWERICRVDEVLSDRPVGKVVGDSGQDRDRVCVAMTNEGEHVALLDRCPHRDIALSGGIVKQGTLVCPGHFWRFDLSTGERTDQSETGAVVYPTRVVDGWVEAMLPPVQPHQSMRERLLAQARANRLGVPETAAQSPEIGDNVTVAGIRTNYHDLGSGPPVVLIHGSGPGVSAWANWRLTLPALVAENFRVIAPDVLGFGYTDRPPAARYDLGAWTDHLVGFLDALELERVSLVGNSFGGALALSLATRHPERVERLVLMGSVGVSFPITAGLDRVWGFEPSLANMRALLDVFAHDHTLVNDDLAGLRLAAATRPGVQDAYAAMFPAPRQASLDAMTIEEDLVRAIGHPTLVVHGREDRVIPLATSLHLHELIQDSQLHVFGQCGHWVQIEHAPDFNRLLADFLGSRR